jgi:hypothetical protein
VRSGHAIVDQAERPGDGARLVSDHALRQVGRDHANTRHAEPRDATTWSTRATTGTTADNSTTADVWRYPVNRAADLL